MKFRYMFFGDNVNYVIFCNDNKVYVNFCFGIISYRMVYLGFYFFIL